MIIKENTTATVSQNPTPDAFPTAVAQIGGTLNIIFSSTDTKGNKLVPNERNKNGEAISVERGNQVVFDEPSVSATIDDNDNDIIQSGGY